MKRKQHPNQLKNLKPPFSKDNPSFARECRAKAADKIRAAQKRKKIAKEVAKAIWLGALPKSMADKVKANFPDADLSSVEAAVFSVQVAKAVLKGEVASALYCRDTSGNKPKEQVAITRNEPKKFVLELQKTENKENEK
jgi:hypothetical protein